MKGVEGNGLRQYRGIRQPGQRASRVIAGPEDRHNRRKHYRLTAIAADFDGFGKISGGAGRGVLTVFRRAHERAQARTQQAYDDNQNGAREQSRKLHRVFYTLSRMFAECQIGPRCPMASGYTES